jgi:nucleotide-binding universal stress UspA family protein
VPNTILIALKDSDTSHAIIDSLADLPLSKPDTKITLLHVFRIPSSTEKLMGDHYLAKEPIRLRGILMDAKGYIVAKGFSPENIAIDIVDEPYPTVAEAIIHHCHKHNYGMVVIGRRQKSKSEEFVLGDVSVKLVRALEKTAVMVIKTTADKPIR